VTRKHLALRVDEVQRRLDGAEAVLAGSREHHVPRLHLLEHEYTQAVLTAELTWLRAVVRDLRDGTLTWKPYA
jgi:hypothetical protein